MLKTMMRGILGILISLKGPLSSSWASVIKWRRSKRSRSLRNKRAPKRLYLGISNR